MKLACRIARSLRDEPTQWTAGRVDLVHPKIGTLIFTPSPMLIVTEHGIWHPGRIERLILGRAVRWRLRQFPKQQIDLAMGGAIPA